MILRLLNLLRSQTGDQTNSNSDALPAAAMPGLTKSVSIQLPVSSPVADPPLDLGSVTDDFPHSVAEALAALRFESKTYENDEKNAELNKNSTESSDASSSATAAAADSATAAINSLSITEVVPLFTKPCSACGDEISILPSTHSHLSDYYDCGASDYSHLKCSMCFGEWLKVCCSDYNFNSLPAKCAESAGLDAENSIGCGITIKDSDIQRILKTEMNRYIMPMYEKACILSGILDLNKSKESEKATKKNVPLTCSKCGIFTALVPSNYKERAAKLKLLMNREIEEEKKQQIKLAAMNEQEEEKIPLDNVAGVNAEIAMPPLIRQQSLGVLTSLYFDCENTACLASTCLRCEKLIDSAKRDSHVCDSNRMNELYEELLGVLAEASTRRCPLCLNAGLKDEACCNITCSDPSHESLTWCYHCGRDSVSMPDYWSHNGWNFDSDDNLKCPQYLQFRYYPECNKFESDGRFPYENQTAGMAALNRFHIVRQQKRLEEWKLEYSKVSSQDAAMIEEMIALKFPKGIFDRQHLIGIEKSEIMRSAWKLERDPPQRGILMEALFKWFKHHSSNDQFDELLIVTNEKRLEYIENAKKMFFQSIIDDRAEKERKRLEGIANAAARAQEFQAEAEARRVARELYRQRRQERADTLRWIRETEAAEAARVAAAEAERREREALALRIAEVARQQEEEFRRLRAAAFARTGSSVVLTTAADRRKQRREMERLRLMALRNNQVQRIQTMHGNEEKKEREEKQ